MPLLGYLFQACLEDQHIVREEELLIVDTESSRQRQLRLRFEAAFPMGSPILRLGAFLFSVLHQTPL